MNEVDRLNSEIAKYNRFMHQCKSHNKSSGDRSSLEQRLQRAQEKAESADGVNQRAEDDMLEPARERQRQISEENQRRMEQKRAREDAENAANDERKAELASRKPFYCQTFDDFQRGCICPPGSRRSGLYCLGGH